MITSVLDEERATWIRGPRVKRRRTAHDEAILVEFSFSKSLGSGACLMSVDSARELLCGLAETLLDKCEAKVVKSMMDY